MQQVFFLILFVVLVKQSSGLECYTCSVTENEADTTCADDVTKMDPGSGSITDCDKKYCTITRVEYLDPKGKLQSFSRSCMDTVPPDGITEDSTHRVYQRSCKTDLCNVGSGKGSTDDVIRNLGAKSTIYAPGTGKSLAIKHVSSLCFVLICLKSVLCL